MVSTLKKTPLTWVAMWLLALAVGAMALMATAQTARAASVTPTQVSGNPTCKTLLSPSPSYEIKVDPPKSGSYGPLTVTFSPDGKLVDFTSTVKVVAVFVKGGTDGGNFYDYRPLGGTLGDTGLKLPTDQQISHVSFCWNEKPEPPQNALEVSKTADATYDRTIKWNLEKSVDDDSHSGQAGDSFTSNYTIKATKTVTEGNHKVTGQIVIKNPASISQSFSVIDELDKPAGTMAKVDCNSDLAGDQPTATVPAGMTFVCTYTASTGTATLNTATVTAAGNSDVKATAPVSYKAIVIGDESVTLSDPTYLSPQTISDTTTKTFPATFKCSTNPADYTNYQRTDIYNNIAYLKGLKTDLSSKASVTVKCRNPWQSETATGAGIRYPGTSNWFMYTPYQTAKVDLIAGQYYDAGDIYMTRPGDGNTYIKITLASGFRFANAAQNLKIQSFAKAPTSYVQPGNYKYKFTVAQGTNTYKAKISGATAKFYGIHADVERYVP